MIFLIDDDPIQIMLISQLIGMNAPSVDYRVFSDGQEALDGLKNSEPPCLILLDINMPIMDGWEFLEVYHKLTQIADVYMLSSSNDERDKNKAKSFECVKGYYQKPIKSTDIVEILGLTSLV